MSEPHSSLEALLAIKNKRIVDELTKIRVGHSIYSAGLAYSQMLICFQIAHTDLESTLQEVSEELRLTKCELEEKRALNERLELDLLQLETRKSSGSYLTPDVPKDGLSDLDLGGKNATGVRYASVAC